MPTTKAMKTAGTGFLLMLAVAALNLPGHTAEEQKAVSAAIAPSGQQQPDTSAARIHLEDIEIEGRLEKPQTVFILPGKDPEVDTIQIDRSFFKEIFRKVDKDDLAKVRKK